MAADEGEASMYNEKWAQSAIADIAQREGMSQSELREQLVLAIALGPEDIDPEVRAFYAAIPHTGEIATPEEMIAFMGGVFQNQAN